jgi:hypothetical protein
MKSRYKHESGGGKVRITCTIELTSEELQRAYDAGDTDCIYLSKIAEMPYTEMKLTFLRSLIHFVRLTQRGINRTKE